MVASPSSLGRRANVLQVADIFRRHGAPYAAAHPLTRQTQKVLRAVMRCRTAALGGHVDTCSDCGYERPSYNSCRNRHCPTCQAGAQEKWIAGQRMRILDTHYFHLVFTLPGELRSVARRSPKRVYDALFAAASETLLVLGRQRLDATLGVTMVLHTWTRAMLFHPHVHCVVTGGGLSLDQTRWNAARPGFLFPIAVMRELFRGKLLARLSIAVRKGELGIDQAAWQSLMRALHRKKWVVFAKRPFGGPEQVIEYLGRYTHRVAIASSRLVAVTDELVTFRTKGGGTETISPAVFVQRFLLHVLPPKFRKIRHYGLLAASNLRTRHARARELRGGLASPPPAPLEPAGAQSEPPESCPVCEAAVLERRRVAPDLSLLPFLPRWRDTS